MSFSFARPTPTRMNLDDQDGDKEQRDFVTSLEGNVINRFFFQPILALANFYHNFITLNRRPHRTALTQKKKQLPWLFLAWRP